MEDHTGGGVEGLEEGVDRVRRWNGIGDVIVERVDGGKGDYIEFWTNVDWGTFTTSSNAINVLQACVYQSVKHAYF